MKLELSDTMRKVSKKQMAELQRRRVLKAKLIADTKVCGKCGQPPDWRGLSLHHKRFLSHSGKTEESNVELICYHCHSKRHHLVER